MPLYLLSLSLVFLCTVSYNFAFSVSHYDGTTLCNYSPRFAYAGENGLSSFWGSLKNPCSPSNIYVALFHVTGLLRVRLLRSIFMSSWATETKDMIHDSSISIEFLCISIRYLLYVVVLFSFYKPRMPQLSV